MRERRPHLLSGDHPLVTVEYCPGLDVGEVGPRVGLREALAPQLLDRLDLGEEPLLLLVGTELDEGRGEEALAEERDPSRRVGPCVLLVEDDLLGDAGAAAPVLERPRDAHPAVAPEQPLPLDAHVPARLVGGAAARPQRGEVAGEMVAEPPAHFGAERGLGGAVTKVHGRGDAT